MKLVSVADRIVFSSIKNFEYGQINLKNYEQKNLTTSQVKNFVFFLRIKTIIKNPLNTQKLRFSC